MGSRRSGPSAPSTAARLRTPGQGGTSGSQPSPRKAPVPAVTSSRQTGQTVRDCRGWASAVQKGSAGVGCGRVGAVVPPEGGHANTRAVWEKLHATPERRWGWREDPRTQNQTQFRASACRLAGRQASIRKSPWYDDRNRPCGSADDSPQRGRPALWTPVGRCRPCSE